MKLFDFLFRSKRSSSASIAKERLQIIVSHERRRPSTPDFLPRLQQDILEVVRKYIQINENQIKLSVDRKGECEILELNISLSNPAVPPTLGRANTK
ncbi:MAG: cell division topological specificity factor [Desulfobulbaceae bacterium BRH_c16a]|nr:MAG: cell division topological specificity factor [Desulfobulbaceae bacterium BRH_c16a]